MKGAWLILLTYCPCAIVLDGWAGSSEEHSIVLCQLNRIWLGDEGKTNFVHFEGELCSQSEAPIRLSEFGLSVALCRTVFATSDGHVMSIKPTDEITDPPRGDFYYTAVLPASRKIPFARKVSGLLDVSTLSSSGTISMTNVSYATNWQVNSRNESTLRVSSALLRGTGVVCITFGRSTNKGPNRVEYRVKPK